MKSLRLPLSSLIFLLLIFDLTTARSAENAMKAEVRTAATATWHFLTAQSVNLRALLPPPPTPGSPAAEADLETVLQVERARTPDQVAWAHAIEQDNVYQNASVLGPWFTASNLPASAVFFKLGQEDGALASRGAKELFNRPRPPATDPRVRACVEVPTTASYPSGHASQAWMWATLLAEIFPEKRAELADRARAVAWGRIIGGVHFPSDIMAGKILGMKIAEELLKNPAVQAAIKQAREEAAPFLMKRAA